MKETKVLLGEFKVKKHDSRLKEIYVDEQRLIYLNERYQQAIRR